MLLHGHALRPGRHSICARWLSSGGNSNQSTRSKSDTKVRLKHNSTKNNNVCRNSKNKVSWARAAARSNSSSAFGISGCNGHVAPLKLSPALSSVLLSPTLASNEKATRMRAEGLFVCHLGFGESPFPVPRVLSEALSRHATAQMYLPTGGLPELQHAAAAYFSSVLGVDLAATHEAPIVAPGSKLILYATQLAVSGDLLMPVPSWVSYAPQARMLGQSVLKVPTALDDGGMHISAAALRDTIHAARDQGKDPRKLLLNAPNNPTGLSIPRSELAELAALCEEEKVLILSDEIYGLVQHDPIAGGGGGPRGGAAYDSAVHFAPDSTLISTGLSKHLSLGGWRLGLGFAPRAVEGLGAALRSIASETWSCVAAPVQLAALEAFSSGGNGGGSGGAPPPLAGELSLEEHVRHCAAVHSLVTGYLYSRLRAAGIPCPRPSGAFYLYPDFGKSPVLRARLAGRWGVHTSDELAAALLDHSGIVALPGTAMGEDPEVLALRLAVCDFNGALALKEFGAMHAARGAGSAAATAARLSDDEVRRFLQTCAPNVLEVGERFREFVEEGSG